MKEIQLPIWFLIFALCQFDGWKMLTLIIIIKSMNHFDIILKKYGLYLHIT